MLDIKRKTLNTYVLDIFQAKTQKAWCSFSIRDLSFLTFYLQNTSHNENPVLLYTTRGMLPVPSDSRMLEPGQILDMIWIQRWSAPFPTHFKVKHFAEIQHLRQIDLLKALPFFNSTFTEYLLHTRHRLNEARAHGD